jgi:hypothetical protein
MTEAAEIVRGRRRNDDGVPTHNQSGARSYVREILRGPPHTRTQPAGITMAKKPLLAFIDSRTNQALRSAKIRHHNNDEKGKRLRSAQRVVPTMTGCYIYAIIVDGVVRYIGKGRNGRMYTHLIEARRTSARCPADTAHLSPRRHRKLVEAIRAGSQIIETVITSGLTDRAAYRLESRMIGEFHKFRAGQLWNTIDERFLDPRYLPDEWDDPEDHVYRLPRPLGNPRLVRGWARSKTYRLMLLLKRSPDAKGAQSAAVGSKQAKTKSAPAGEPTGSRRRLTAQLATPTPNDFISQLSAAASESSACSQRRR